MAFSTRKVAYEATVDGFDRAEAAITQTDKALDNAADGADEVADAFGKVGAEAGKAAAPLREAGEGVKKTGEEAKKAKSPIEAFEKGVGTLSKVLGGFGLLAIPGAIDGIVSLVTRVWEWTDAGKRATEMQEAQAAAVQKTVDKLLAMEVLISKVGSRDIVEYTRATREQTRVQGELTKAIDEQIAAEERVNKWRAEAEGMVRGAARTAMDQAQRDAAAAAKRVDELREAYARVNTLVRDFDDRRVFESADDLRGRIEAAAKAADTAAKKTADQAAKLAAIRRQTQADFESDELVAMADLDLSGFEAEARILTERVGSDAAEMAARLAEAFITSGDSARAMMAQLAAEAQRAADAIFAAWSAGPTAAMEQFGQGLADNIAAALVLGESVKEAAAKALEGLEIQALGEVIFQGAKALASFGAFLLTGAPNALASAKAHAASAAAFAVIAKGADIAGDALGGVPQEKKAPRQLDDAERERTTSAGGSGSGGPSVTNNNFNFAGSLLNTERDFQRLVRGALKDSESATGLPRPNFAKIGGV